MVTNTQMVPGGSGVAKPVIATISSSHSSTKLIPSNQRKGIETPDFLLLCNCQLIDITTSINSLNQGEAKCYKYDERNSQSK